VVLLPPPVPPVQFFAHVVGERTSNLTRRDRPTTGLHRTEVTSYRAVRRRICLTIECEPLVQCTMKAAVCLLRLFGPHADHPRIEQLNLSA
jgi:hypothetical protein